MSRIAPALVVVPIAVGNFSPAMWTWGFNYYVLGLPFASTSEWISSSLALFIVIYPLLNRPLNRFRLIYSITIVVALTVLCIRLSFVTVGLRLHLEPVMADTESIFANIEAQLFVLVVFCGYLIFCLIGEVRDRKDFVLVLVSVIVAALYVGDYSANSFKRVREVSNHSPK